jgi:putative addiction module killer protein
MVEIRHYVTQSGIDVLAEWLAELADDHARARIADRIDRLSGGNFGDRKSLGGGLGELRIH